MQGTSPEGPKAWIARIAQNGDREAFAALYAHYAPQVKRYLMRSGADPVTAEEVTQDVLLTVWRRAPTYDPGRANPNTWIFTIARNRRIDRFRKEKRPKPEATEIIETMQPTQGTDTQVAEGRRATAVREALASLPPEQAEVLRISYFEGRSMREMSDQTGVPLGTIKSRSRLAMIRLRQVLEDLESRP
jgi:RNA polymerase sigma factor (sigma-70 family)